MDIKRIGYAILILVIAVSIALSINENKDSEVQDIINNAEYVCDCKKIEDTYDGIYIDYSTRTKKMLECVYMTIYKSGNYTECQYFEYECIKKLEDMGVDCSDFKCGGSNNPDDYKYDVMVAEYRKKIDIYENQQEKINKMIDNGTMTREQLDIEMAILKEALDNYSYKPPENEFLRKSGLNGYMTYHACK